MQRALPLVASFCSAWTGGPDPLSRPAADRPPPDPSGAASLLPSRVPGGIAVWDRSTWRSTASGHLDALEHTTAAPRTVPLRTYAVGTPEAPGHEVRVWRHVRWPHTHPCFRALASEAARQCARGPAGVAPGSLTPLCQPPGRPPVAVPAGAPQEPSRTLRGPGAQDQHSQRPGVVEEVVRRPWVILGGRDRRQQRLLRGHYDALPGGARSGASGCPPIMETDVLERSQGCMRGVRVPEAAARLPQSLCLRTGATGNAAELFP